MEKETLHEQNQFILGEFYVKKGDLLSARGIFSDLTQTYPNNCLYSYFMGKINLKLGNIDQALINLQKSRVLNPIHRPTLSLLAKCFLNRSQFYESLECLVDSYLLCKETKNKRADVYKNKIRELVKKMSPTLEDQQKNVLIKNRLEYLTLQLQNLQKIYKPEASTQVPLEHEKTPPETNINELHSHKTEPQTLVKSIHAEIAEPPKMNRQVESSPLPDRNPNPIFDNDSLKISDFSGHILFKSLAVEEIETIRKFSSIQTFNQNEIILHPSEPIYGFHCILKGRVAIAHRGRVLLELEQGSIIDEAEIAHEQTYRFEYIALEPCTLLQINKAAFLTLCKRQHKLATHFLWHFYKSLGLKINSVLENILLQNPEQKILDNLDKLFELSQLRLFNALELDTLQKKFPKILKNKNDFLFKNQDPMSDFYILLEGTLSIQHPTSSETFLINSGEFVSELGLLSNIFEHTMNAKIISDQATLLSIDRQYLGSFHNPVNRDEFRIMETFWKIFSRKYFEFMNFYFEMDPNKH